MEFEKPSKANFDNVLDLTNYGQKKVQKLTNCLGGPPRSERLG
jgi:hypothetical protein